MVLKREFRTKKQPASVVHVPLGSASTFTAFTATQSMTRTLATADRGTSSLIALPWSDSRVSLMRLELSASGLRLRGRGTIVSELPRT